MRCSFAYMEMACMLQAGLSWDGRSPKQTSSCTFSEQGRLLITSRKIPDRITMHMVAGKLSWKTPIRAVKTPAHQTRQSVRCGLLLPANRLQHPRGLVVNSIPERNQLAVPLTTQITDNTRQANLASAGSADTQARTREPGQGEARRGCQERTHRRRRRQPRATRCGRACRSGGRGDRTQDRTGGARRSSSCRKWLPGWRPW